MATLVSLGSALQDIYLLDRDDFTAASFDDRSIFGDITIGSKIDIDRTSFEVGGGGTNAAVAFARCGHDSVFLGNIGRDPAGAAIVSCLDDEGVDTSSLQTVRGSTGVSVILLDMRSGERTILTHRGTSAKYDNLDPHLLDDLAPDWLYVTSMRGDLATLERFLKHAFAHKIKVMINPGRLELDQPKELRRLLKFVDILLLNQSEARELVPGQTLTELASRLRNYVPTVILTAGSMGALAVSPDEIYRLGMYEDVKVKDTTGAGDAFGSGFLAHFAAGHSFKDSLIFASANSTSVVSHLGAKRGLLTGQEKLHPMPYEQLQEL